MKTYNHLERHKLVANLFRFAFFAVVCVTSILLFFSMMAQASPSVAQQPPACQQAQKNMQAHFKKANAILDDVVIFTQLDKQTRAEIDHLYLKIEQELLALAKKGVLHQCDLSELASAGLQLNVSKDGQFRIYDWVTDYETEEMLGYTTVMYAQPKQVDFPPAQSSESHYGEFSQLITIPKPVEASDKNDADFPIYAVVTRHFLRGQRRIHCEPSLSLFLVVQNHNFAYITEIGFRFLDTNGKEIGKIALFGNGCDGDTRVNDYIENNQFYYDEETQTLSFRLSVMTDVDAETLPNKDKYKHYRFRFNGTDFVQLK